MSSLNYCLFIIVILLAFQTRNILSCDLFMLLERNYFWRYCLCNILPDFNVSHKLFLSSISDIPYCGILSEVLYYERTRSLLKEHEENQC